MAILKIHNQSGTAAEIKKSFNASPSGGLRLIAGALVF
jgi:hypothetical protein